MSYSNPSKQTKQARKNKRKISGYHSKNNSAIPQKMHKYITHKILNILLDSGGLKKFLRRNQIQEEDIALFLGLDDFLDTSISFIELKKILESKRESISCDHSPHKELSKNISNLAKLIGLNKVECQILEFALIFDRYSELSGAMDLLGYGLKPEDFKKRLSSILGISDSQINKAFSPEGVFQKTSILGCEEIRPGYFEFINREFSPLMFRPIKDISIIFRDEILPCSKSELTLQDYEHIKTDLKLIIPFLKKSIAQKRRGVNLLLYGKPGTGKTELAKVLAERLKVSLYEISYYAEHRNSIATGDHRLISHQIAQTILPPKSTILMYDEAEDLFEYSSNNFFGFKPQKNKAYINRTLENNLIPTIWITNNISSVDPAIIRRFDYVLDMPIPPIHQRQKIISKYTHNLLDEDTISELNHHNNIAPSMIEKTSNLIKTLHSKTPSQDFRHALNNTLHALNTSKLSNPDTLPQNYNLDFINTDANLKEIIKGIRANPNARLCLYGNSGTGKSAYAKYLSQCLKLPYIIKKCSDLISPYVGTTERNIAQAFNEAKTQKGVLIFDEVDSFLFSRENAQRSFESSLVNEMLVQMEEFNGIFIATTNFIDRLDSACLRRFDLKLEFKTLKATQTLQLFKQECILYKIPFCKDLEEKISTLTPISAGDFDTIRRQSRFQPLQNAWDLYERLCKEVQSKPQNTSKTLGFI